MTTTKKPERNLIIVPITGRRKSGKDTVASLAVSKFRCSGTIALGDWFKVLLSKHFKVPLDHFYGPERDRPLPQPIQLRHSDISRLIASAGSSVGNHVDVRFQKISISKWVGRQINSLRELMIWFAQEVITNSVGADIHNQITQKAITNFLKDRPIHPRAFDVVLIPDVRQYPQSVWFSSKAQWSDKKPRYEFVYPIKIERPDGTFDQTSEEVAVDAFPAGYFFETIVNDGTIAELEGKVKETLERIRAAAAKAKAAQKLVKP